MTMKIITSRYWKKCDANHCIILTNQKIFGSVNNWYFCFEHLTEERLEEAEASCAV